MVYPPSPDYGFQIKSINFFESRESFLKRIISRNINSENMNCVHTNYQSSNVTSCLIRILFNEDNGKCTFKNKYFLKEKKKKRILLFTLNLWHGHCDIKRKLDDPGLELSNLKFLKFFVYFK